MRNKKISNVFLPCFLIIHLYVFCLAQEKDIDKNLVEEGVSYYKSGKYEEAIEAFSEVIRTSINKDILFKAYVYLGYTYFTLGDYEEAKSPLEKGLETKPDLILDADEFVPDFVKFFKNCKKEIVGIGFIESVPSDSFVYLDNDIIGSTPMKKELLSKKYIVRLVKWGYSPIEAEFEIVSNEVTNIKIDLTKGKNWKTFLRSSLVMIAVAFLLESI